MNKAEKKKRLAILNDKVKEAHLKSNEKYIGKILEILIDDVKDSIADENENNENTEGEN